MPCTYDTPDNGTEYTRLQNEIAKLTRMLCFAMQNSKQMEVEISDFKTAKVSQELQQWWTEHQKQDTYKKQQEAAARQRQEAVKTALSKLTPYERQLLKV